MMRNSPVRTAVTVTLGRYFYPLSIVGVLLVLLAVHVRLEPAFAIFGLYPLIGLVAGAIVYYGTDGVPGHVTPSMPGHVTHSIDTRIVRVGVYSVSFVCIGVVAVTGEPLLILPGLLVANVLIVYQLFHEPDPQQLVPQITLVFLLSPITKYLTAGLYIGHGDILIHVRFVEDIIAGGSVDAISYASYHDFPGLQLVAATAGLLSGLGSYHGIMLTGLAGFTVVIPAVYLVFTRLTGHPQLALCTAFAVAVLDDISFFASYAFPQSLATVMICVLAVLLTLSSHDAIEWRITGLAVFVAIVLSFTHHLTQVLFLPLLSLGLVLFALQYRNNIGDVVRSRQVLLLFLILGVTASTLFRTGFVERLAAAGTLVLSGGSRGGYTQGATFKFGNGLYSRSATTALEWLVSPYGIFLVLLVLVFSVGVVTFLRSSHRPVSQTTLFWTGIVGSLLVFETPLAIKSLIRIRSPWLFAFAFVLGFAFLQFRRRAGTTRQRRLLMSVIVLVAVCGPLVTVDDYYDLDSRPTMQTSYSDEEVAEFEALSGYLRGKEASTTAFSPTQRVTRSQGVDELQNSRIDDRSLVIPEGYFVYRTTWPGETIHFSASEDDRLYSNTLYVSEAWVRQYVMTENTVYTVGRTGVTWRSSDRTIDSE